MGSRNLVSFWNLLKERQKKEYQFRTELREGAEFHLINVIMELMNVNDTQTKKKEDEEGSNVALLPSITFGTSIDYDLYWLTGYKRQQFLPTFTFFLFVVLSYFK